MAFFAEDLWCDVVGSSAESSFPLSVKINFCGQAEITQLDLKLQQEQKVFNFMGVFSVAQIWEMTGFLFDDVLPKYCLISDLTPYVQLLFAHQTASCIK